MRWVCGLAWMATVSVVGACSGRSVRNISIDAPAGGTSAPAGGSSSGGTSMGGSGAIPPRCEPQEAIGVGACEIGLGVFFTGASCAFVSGCSCEGEDCDTPYASEEQCVQANRGCVVGCGPQDATILGGPCRLPPRVVFTGVGCVQFSGCNCVGEDCDSTYAVPTLDPAPPVVMCESAHASCATTPRSCQEIADVYAVYASRNACQADEDCHVARGHCSIGLGSCYSVMNVTWPVEGLSTLAAEWQSAGCTGPVCSCPPPPTVVQCLDGVCVGSQ